MKLRMTPSTGSVNLKGKRTFISILPETKLPYLYNRIREANRRGADRDRNGSLSYLAMLITPHQPPESHDRKERQDEAEEEVRLQRAANDWMCHSWIIRREGKSRCRRPNGVVARGRRPIIWYPSVKAS